MLFFSLTNEKWVQSKLSGEKSENFTWDTNPRYGQWLEFYSLERLDVNLIDGPETTNQFFRMLIEFACAGHKYHGLSIYFAEEVRFFLYFVFCSIFSYEQEAMLLVSVV